MKLYITDEEKRRLEILAKLRFTTVPNYIKMTALGVKIQQVKEVYIEQEEFKYPTKQEQLFSSDDVITSEEKAVLEELLNRSNNEGYIKYDLEFNKRLQDMAKRILAKE